MGSPLTNILLPPLKLCSWIVPGISQLESSIQTLNIKMQTSDCNSHRKTTKYITYTAAVEHLHGYSFTNLPKCDKCQE